MREEFDRCWPWLEAALDTYAFRHEGKVWPTHRKEHVWERIFAGKSIFWPGKTCAIITEIHVSPTGLKTHTTWLTGGIPNESLDEIKVLTEVIEDFGRNQGCHRQAGHGRAGWARVLAGYEVRGGIHKFKNLLKA